MSVFLFFGLPLDFLSLLVPLSQPGGYQQGDGDGGAE
jgi:hypothetical protein